MSATTSEVEKYEGAQKRSEQKKLDLQETITDKNHTKFSFEKEKERKK